MAKFPTSPTLINELSKLSTKNLRLLNYFKEYSFKAGTLNWKRGNQIKVSIRVNIQDTVPYLELDYSYNKNLLNYRVQLVTVPSNLGKEIIWYFICPNIRKRCRKLYFANGYFVSRFAFTHAMYEQQTYSHRTRNFHKVFGKTENKDNNTKELQKPYFKIHYAGKPTKKLLRITKELKQLGKFDQNEFNRLF